MLLLKFLSFLALSVGAWYLMQAMYPTLGGLELGLPAVIVGFVGGPTVFSMVFKSR